MPTKRHAGKQLQDLQATAAAAASSEALVQVLDQVALRQEIASESESLVAGVQLQTVLPVADSEQRIPRLAARRVEGIMAAALQQTLTDRLGQAPAAGQAEYTL